MIKPNLRGNLLALLLLSSVHCYATAASVGSSTNSWFAISGPNFDPTSDAQTGDPRAELVGDATNPGLYFAFDNPNNALNDPNSRMLFRARVAQYAISGNTPTGYGSAIFIGIDVGIDGNFDGKIDIFVAADDRGNAAANGVKLYYPKCPNSGACNTGPSTTNLSNQVGTTSAFVTTGQNANFNWAAVSSTTDPRPNLDTDVSSPSDSAAYKQVDGFFSFAVSMGSVSDALKTAPTPIANFNAASQIRVIAITAQQLNSLNQDLGGCNGNASSLTWTCGLSSSFTPQQYSPSPEPGTFAAGAGVLVAMVFVRRRRKGCR